MKLNLDRYNERIKNDLGEVVSDIQTEGNSLGIQHRENSPSSGPSLPKIKGATKEHDGQVDQLSIKFRRSLIWTQKGAGKGRGGNKGSKWVDKYGATKTTNPKSLGKMGTNGRVEKPFINNVLDSEKGVEKIATTAAEELGDAIVNNILVK